MGHRYWLKNLSAYLDHELKENKRKKIELHLSQCPVCQSKLSDWQKIQSIQKSVPSLQPDEKIWQSIYREIHSNPLPKLHFWEEDFDLGWFFKPAPVLTIALIVLLLAFSVQPIFRLNGTDPGEIPEGQYINGTTDLLADIPPDLLIQEMIIE